MNLLFRIIIFACLITTFLSAEGKDLFSKYFRLTSTIQISDDVVIGEISHLDINKNGDILLTDVIGNAVFLFDKTGHIIKQLSTQPCQSSFIINPIEAKFFDSGTIFMTNSGPWGYLFNENGDCLSEVDKYFTPPYNFCCSNYLYGIYPESETTKILKMDKKGKKIETILNKKFEFQKIINRWSIHNSVVYTNNSVFFVLATDPVLYKIDKNKKLNSIDFSPSYFTRIEEDIIEYTGNKKELLDDLNNKIKDRTTISSIFLFAKDKFLIQLSHRGYNGIEIIDLKGNKLISEEILTNKYFLFVENGKLYRVVDNEIDQNGNIANPKIEVYELR